MGIKKISAAVMAAAVMAVSTPVMGLSNPFGVTASAAEEAELVNEIAPRAALTAPQNLRLENGSIVWDEVEGANGYVLRTIAGGKDFTQTCGTTNFNLNRFCYENKFYFGNYEFTVCAFNDVKNGDWSAPLTFSFAPSISVPSNIKQSEDINGTSIISWDPVENAFRYNVRMVYYNKDGKTAGEMDYKYAAGDSNHIQIESYAKEVNSNSVYSDNYSFMFQTMDHDYNISEWSEPITVQYVLEHKSRLDLPKNVRLDESGDNILWDPVEGADKYGIQIHAFCSIYNIEIVKNTTSTRLDDWKKCIMVPLPNIKYEINVIAYDSHEKFLSSGLGAYIIVQNDPIRDESIKMPNDIQINGGALSLSNVDGIYEYFAVYSFNDTDLIAGSTKAETNSLEPSFRTMPDITYDVELYVVDQNRKYNNKTYTVKLDTPHDETIWVPELYYFNSSLIDWDYDKLMNSSSGFWTKVTRDNNIVDLRYDSYNGYNFIDLPDGEYSIETCVVQNGKLGKWSKPFNLIKYKGSNFNKDNETTTEVETPLEATEIPEGDRITSITINPAFNMKNKNDNNVELDLSKINIKAKEIYNDAGLKRASEALGTTISGNTHYNLLDLTLLYDGKDFSNGYNGLVQVIIPIPKGHRDKFFSCYRIVEKNGVMTKELIPGKQTEDSYIIYLEHFSEYALVGSDVKEEHVHTWNEGVVTKQPTTSSEGVKTYTCTICSETKTEAIPKLSSSSSGGSGSRPSGGSSRPLGMTNKETSEVIESTESGGTARIDGNILILPEIIKEAVERNVDLEVTVDRNFTWNIDTDKLGEIDTVLRLSVTKKNADPDKILMIEKSSGSINNADLSFSTYAKNLGTGATLTVRTSERSATSAKMFANLYKINADGDLEFVAAAPIDEDGYATFPITETATYTLITSTETKKPGDINNDCKVDITDISAMLKKYVNSQSLSRATDFKMDYNNDGQCNMSDITALLRAYVDDKV